MMANHLVTVPWDVFARVACHSRSAKKSCSAGDKLCCGVHDCYEWAEVKIPLTYPNGHVACVAVCLKHQDVGGWTESLREACPVSFPADDYPVTDEVCAQVMALFPVMVDLGDYEAKHAEYLLQHAVPGRE